MVTDKKEKCDLLVGQIVRSKAGRDKGEVFIVYEVLNGGFVSVVDGRRRPIARPKKKKFIHLQKYNTIIESFEKMKNDMSFNDAYIRKTIIGMIKEDLTNVK